MQDSPDQRALVVRVPPDVVAAPPPPNAPVGQNEPQSIEPLGQDELQRLRAMLREQEEATQKAVRIAGELQNKLSEAQTEIEKAGKKSQELPTPVTLTFAEAEAYWPSREEPSFVSAEATAKYRNALAAMITLAVALTIICCCVVFWAASGTPQFWKTPVPPPMPASLHPDDPSAISTPDPNSAFTTAVEGLDDALAAFPGKMPADVLWEASQKDPSCMLQWNDGVPSFLFGAGVPHRNSLAFAISQCADAVRHLRRPVSR